MRYLHFSLIILATLVIAVLAIPIVWIGLILAPFAILVSVPVFVFAGLMYGRFSGDSIRMPCARVLLIDNEAETHKLVSNFFGSAWTIRHAASSFRAIGTLLSESKAEFDYIVIRWTRRKLSGERLLDFLDQAIAIREERRGESGEICRELPPVLFLRKSGASPFDIRRSHKAPVLGCVDLDSRTLKKEVQACLKVPS